MRVMVMIGASVETGHGFDGSTGDALRTQTRPGGTEVTEATEITGGTEEQRRAERTRARQWAGAAGPARNDTRPENTNPAPIKGLRFRSACRRVTRFAGLSRAAACPLRSSSVSPFLCGHWVISVTSVY